MKNPSKEQVQLWNQTYYAKNKDKFRESNRNVREKLRVWYRNLKSTLVCNRCGFAHPAALEFHHINPDEKSFEVARLVGMGASERRILEEIAKCEVLCSNCHAIEHWIE